MIASVNQPRRQRDGDAFVQYAAPPEPYEGAMNAKGTFEIKMNAEPPYDVVDGVSLGRVSFDKRFTGALEATSTVQMIGARTPVEGSGVYVAMERVKGTLDGKTGTFALYHLGTQRGGKRTLDVVVVPDSGTGELRGLSGKMDIQIEDGKHFYEFEFAFEG